MKQASSELFASTAVDDKVDRAVDDGAKSGEHVKIDLPSENVVSLLLFIASDNGGNPDLNKFLNFNKIDLLSFKTSTFFTLISQKCQAIA